MVKICFLLSLLQKYLKPSFAFKSPLLSPACYFCTGNIFLSKRLLNHSVCSPTSSSCEPVTYHELPGAQASTAIKAPDETRSSNTDSGGGTLPCETEPGPLFYLKHVQIETQVVSFWRCFNVHTETRITPLGVCSSNQWSLVLQQLQSLAEPRSHQTDHRHRPDW